MPVLSYGNYTHPDHGIAVAIRRQRRSNPDGTKPWDHVTWTIRGFLSGYANQAALLSAISALRTAYAVNDCDLTLKQTSGGTTLESLTDASTLSGVYVTQGPGLPVDFGPELVTYHHYEIVVEADVAATGSLTSYDEHSSTSYEVNERKLTTKTSRGQLRTPFGTSAAALFASKDPGAPSAVYHLASRSYQVNEVDTELTWAYAYAESPAAWPSGVYSPSVTQQLEKNEQGQMVRTVSATFFGPNAQIECQKLKLSGLVCLASSESANPYDGSYSITYRYLDTQGSRELLSFVSSLTWEIGGADFVMRAALNGKPPVQQQTVQKGWRCVEQGTAVGLTKFPNVPAPAYPAANLHSGGSISRRGPIRLSDGTFSNFEITWNRVFEFATDPGYKNPVTG